MFAADVDGDGDLDVLSASLYDDKIAWYENDGSQNFTRPHDHHRRRRGRSACSRRTWTATATWTSLSASFNDDKIAWYENDGSQNVHRPHDHHRAPTAPAAVFAADVDGDGDLDVLSASRRRRQDRLVRERRQRQSFDGPHDHHRAPTAPAACSRPTWTATATWTSSPPRHSTTRSPGTRTTAARTFTARTITHRRRRGPLACSRRTWTATATATSSPRRSTTTRSPGTRTTAARTFDSPTRSPPPPTAACERVRGGRGRRRRPGRPLRVAATTTRSPGTRTTAARTSLPHTITTAADGGQSVFAADVDGDGDLDVLSASLDDDKIAWYENDGSRELHAPHDHHRRQRGHAACSRRTWTATATWTSSPRRPYDDKIAWYENDGSQNFTARTRSPPPPNGATRVFAADVDGDGDLDVLSASLRSTTRSPGTRTTARPGPSDPTRHHHRRRRRRSVYRGGRGRRRRPGRPLRVARSTTRSPGTRTTARPSNFGPCTRSHHAADGADSVYRGGRGRRRRPGRPLRLVRSTTRSPGIRTCAPASSPTASTPTATSPAGTARRSPESAGRAGAARPTGRSVSPGAVRSSALR